jgi:hypothetical protein
MVADSELKSYLFTRFFANSVFSACVVEVRNIKDFLLCSAHILIVLKSYLNIALCEGYTIIKDLHN